MRSSGLAGRALNAAENTAPTALIVHPDIRRMLLTQKAIAEGGRAFVLYCAIGWISAADIVAAGGQAAPLILDVSRDAGSV